VLARRSARHLAAPSTGLPLTTAVPSARRLLLAVWYGRVRHRALRVRTSQRSPFLAATAPLQAPPDPTENLTRVRPRRRSASRTIFIRTPVATSPSRRLATDLDRRQHAANTRCTFACCRSRLQVSSRDSWRSPLTSGTRACKPPAATSTGEAPAHPRVERAGDVVDAWFRADLTTRNPRMNSPALTARRSTTRTFPTLCKRSPFATSPRRTSRIRPGPESRECPKLSGVSQHLGELVEALGAARRRRSPCARG